MAAGVRALCIEDSMASTAAGGFKWLKITLVLYLVMFGLKLSVYFATGVMALLAEALHTLSDVFVCGFLLIAAIGSRKRADQEHMFGHGRAQYVGALVAATLFISFTSLELYREAIPRLFHPQSNKPQNLSLAVGVLLLSILVTAAPMLKLLGTRARGPALKAQLLELVNDQLGLIAALVGTLFIIRGAPIADPIASLVVASVIGVNGIVLFRENLSLLLGRSPGGKVLAEIGRLAEGVDGVIAVADVKAQMLGEDSIDVHMSIRTRPDITIVQGRTIADEVIRQLGVSAGCTHCVVQVLPERVPPDSPR
jgi:cation diffusion facilitator family transporter